MRSSTPRTETAMSETPRTADEALERAVEYAAGHRSDLWNTLLGATEAGSSERMHAHAAISTDDAAKAFAWSAVSMAMRAREVNGDA
jgi:hypothetical protein